jgi:hypothetical protein
MRQRGGSRKPGLARYTHGPWPKSTRRPTPELTRPGSHRCSSQQWSRRVMPCLLPRPALSFSFFLSRIKPFIEFHRNYKRHQAAETEANAYVLESGRSVNCPAVCQPVRRPPASRPGCFRGSQATGVGCMAGLPCPLINLSPSWSRTDGDHATDRNRKGQRDYSGSRGFIPSSRPAPGFRFQLHLQCWPFASSLSLAAYTTRHGRSPEWAVPFQSRRPPLVAVGSLASYPI